MSDKMQEEFKSCSLHDDYVEVKSLEENRKWSSAGWQAARTVPEGFVMVPVEPTSDMVCAALDAGTIDDDDVLWVWGEMLSAAPAPNEDTSHDRQDAGRV